MNLATGLKEAHLKVPETEDTLHADLVLGDEISYPQNLDQHPESPLSTRHQSALGAQRAYVPPLEPVEFDIFAKATKELLLNTSATTTLDALSTLTDQSLTQYWGLSFAQDHRRSKSLLINHL